MADGDAAKTYFQGFGRMVLGDFGFPGRRKRLATDPVNAMLSLGFREQWNVYAKLCINVPLLPKPRVPHFRPNLP